MRPETGVSTFPYNHTATLEGLSRGTCCGDWVWTDHVVPQPGQKTQAWVALSENAPKACLLLTGQDLPVLSCWISSLASGRGSAGALGNRSRLSAK